MQSQTADGSIRGYIDIEMTADGSLEDGVDAVSVLPSAIGAAVFPRMKENRSKTLFRILLVHWRSTGLSIGGIFFFSTERRLSWWLEQRKQNAIFRN